MNVVAGLFLAAHAFAHLVGFVGAFSLMPSVPHHTTILAGRIDLGEAGARAAGMGWLFAAIGFAIAAVGAFVDVSWWPRFVVVASIASLAMCLLYLPDTRIGVAVNAALLLVFVFGRAAVWWLIRD